MHSEKLAVVRTERLVIASPLQSHGEGTFPVPNHPSQAWTFMLLKSTSTHPRPITSSPLLARACPSQSVPIRICLLDSSLLAQRSRPCCQVSLCQAMSCRQGWNYLDLGWRGRPHRLRIGLPLEDRSGLSSAALSRSCLETRLEWRCPLLVARRPWSHSTVARGPKG